MSARIELLILLLGLVGVQLGCTTTVEWYRTAQGTDDRLTRQSDIVFGADFASDVTVAINR